MSVAAPPVVAVILAALLIKYAFPHPRSDEGRDRVYDAEGHELKDCRAHWDECVAQHCLYGYDTIAWRDFDLGSTYRCKPKPEGRP
jgi:hypothetical protein